MTVSAYTFLMAVLWFSVFVLIGTLLQHKKGFVNCFRLGPLLILLSLTLFRLVVPIETQFTQVIRSTTLLPAVQAMLDQTCILLNGVPITNLHIIWGIWGAVATLLVVRLYLQLCHDRQVFQRISAMPSQGTLKCLESVMAQKKCTKKIRIYVSSEIVTPMLVGLLKPAILLPRKAEDLPICELEYILVHELTHLLHRDLWVKFLVRLICCLMWWNPCVYLLKKDLDCILEYQCDLSVTKTMLDDEKVEYLQTILEILKRLAKEPTSPCGEETLHICFAGIPEAVVLRQRFQLVLGQDRNQKRSTVVAFIFILFTLFLFSYSVILQPAYEPPESDFINKIEVTPENSYILKTTDGAYYLVYMKNKAMSLSPEILDESPFDSLVIQNQIIEEG